MHREQWIDVYRGIGIVLVVWGHVYGGYSFDLIFLFHMPLFFFISGYLFHPVTDVAAFCRRKAAQLLIPYAVFLLIIGIPLAIGLWRHHPQDAAMWRDFAAAMLLGGNRLSAWLAAFWFVTAFYGVLVIEAVLIGRCGRAALLWIHAAMLVLAYANAAFAPGWHAPFAANVVLAAAPFFYAGYLFRQSPDPRRWHRPAAVVAICAIAAVLFNHDQQWHLSLGYDMKVTQYGVPGLTFGAALACCVCVMRIARAIQIHWPYLAAMLAQLGQAAIVIMFTHMVFTMGVALWLGEGAGLPRVTAGLFGGWLLYRLALCRCWSRALLLGSAADQQAMRGRRRAMRG